MYIHSHVFLGHKFFKTITLVVAITCTRVVAVAVVVVATRSGISNVIIII